MESSTWQALRVCMWDVSAALDYALALMNFVHMFWFCSLQSCVSLFGSQ